LGILDRIGEDRCSVGLVARALQHPLESLAVEDVISQDQGDVVLTDELPANEKCLGQSTGTRLHGVPDGKADLSSIPQDPLKILDIVWRGYQENLANAGKHQRREGIVNHRLVVDRQELLADGSGNRIEPRTRTTGQNDAFAKHAWRFLQNLDGSPGLGVPRAVRLAPCLSIVPTGKPSEAIPLLWVDSKLVASDFSILSWTGNARSPIMDHDSNLYMSSLPASSQDVPGIARKST